MNRANFSTCKTIKAITVAVNLSVMMMMIMKANLASFS